MSYPASGLALDPSLVRRHVAGAPDYTSYPALDRFVEAFGEDELVRWLGKRCLGGIGGPLSVRVRLPEGGRPAKYIEYLARELRGIARHLHGVPAAELHWSHAGRAALARDEARGLAAGLQAAFALEAGCDRTVELDARHASPGTLEFLAGLGFNRLALTARDFDPRLQRIGAEARACGFRSVSFHLRYALPGQTLARFGRVLDRCIALAPDDILLRCDGLRQRDAALEMLAVAIVRLTGAGYAFLGMEHFARADDELAVAQRQGRLQRGLRGYAARPERDVVALGVGAIGRIGPTYYQNSRRAREYRAAIDAGRLPVARGIELTPDDLARRAVIQALACHARVSIESIELAHLIDFRGYFAAEMRELARLEDEGLVEMAGDWIGVTPRGRLVTRAACRVFDRYRPRSLCCRRATSWTLRRARYPPPRPARCSSAPGA